MEGWGNCMDSSISPLDPVDMTHLLSITLKSTISPANRSTPAIRRALLVSPSRVDQVHAVSKLRARRVHTLQPFPPSEPSISLHDINRIHSHHQSFLTLFAMNLSILTSKDSP